MNKEELQKFCDQLYDMVDLIGSVDDDVGDQELRWHISSAWRLLYKYCKEKQNRSIWSKRFWWAEKLLEHKK